MAEASGLAKIAPEQRNPLFASSYGTGELLLHCLEHKVKTIILGIGGSATNDGGIGMARALGVDFLDSTGASVVANANGSAKVERINDALLDTRLATTRIIVASDVSNPLFGPEGATLVYGAQKGASPEMLEKLEQHLTHYGHQLNNFCHREISSYPGAGAAGGLGAALLAFTHCEFRRGIELVMEFTALKEKFLLADYCFTGEGRIDKQTGYGKTITGIAALGKQYQVPVISLAGTISENTANLDELGVTAVFSIIKQNKSLDELLKNGPDALTDISHNIAKILASSRN